MAATSNTTLLQDLFDPQVVADEINRKLVDGIRFAPLAMIDYSLVGRDGDEISLPAYDYIGDAVGVAEGADIPIAKLTQSTSKVKVSKIGKGVQFTDEALLSGNSNSIATQATTQVVTAINSALETKLLDEMSTTAKLTATVAATDDGASGILAALENFGEDIDGEKVILVPPSYYGRLAKSTGWIPNTEIGANIIIKGAVGAVYGCQIVISNRLAARNTYVKTTDTTIDSSKTYYTFDSEVRRYNAVTTPVADDLDKYYEVSGSVGATAYIVKPGALAIYMKRDTLVEFDRDIVDQTNYIIGSKLFAPYVYDKSKLIKLTLA